MRPPPVAHRHRPARVVDHARRVLLEHAGYGAVPVELRCRLVEVAPLAVAGDLAEEEPLVVPVVDVVAFGPAAACSGQAQSGRGALGVVLVEPGEVLPGAGVVVVARVGGDADAPVLVAVPAVVEDAALGALVGVDGPVDVGVVLRALGIGPVLVAQIVDDAHLRQVVAEGDVAPADGAVDDPHRHADRLLAEPGVALDGRDQSERDDLRVAVGPLVARGVDGAAVGPGALARYLLQPRARAQDARMLLRDGVLWASGGRREERQRRQDENQPERSGSQHGIPPVGLHLACPTYLYTYTSSGGDCAPQILRKPGHHPLWCTLEAS